MNYFHKHTPVWIFLYNKTLLSKHANMENAWLCNDISVFVFSKEITLDQIIAIFWTSQFCEEIHSTISRVLEKQNWSCQKAWKFSKLLEFVPFYPTITLIIIFIKTAGSNFMPVFLSPFDVMIGLWVSCLENWFSLMVVLIFIAFSLSCAYFVITEVSQLNLSTAWPSVFH